VFSFKLVLLIYDRLQATSRVFNEGGRRLKAFGNITDLSDLPVLTGDEYEMLAQWLVVVLHDGSGILSPTSTKVCVSVALCQCAVHSAPKFPLYVSGVSDIC
jgi:hypothetical protein